MLNVTKTETGKGRASMPMLTQEQLAQLGEGLVAYVKPIRSEDVRTVFPDVTGEVAPGLQLFALLAANGQPLVLTDSRDAAVANAMENELHMVSLH